LPKIASAVLRNAAGEFMMRLSEADVEVYEVLAEQGLVKRSAVPRKGQTILIFKLMGDQYSALPKLHPDPSNSPDSACSLTRNDSLGLAGMNFPDSQTSRFQIERWSGYGLLVRRPAHA
jgi:hypothetical protein